jgi:hypothetical protein
VAMVAEAAAIKVTGLPGRPAICACETAVFRLVPNCVGSQFGIA